jgi:hypothetical protein
MINRIEKKGYKLTAKESIAIAEIMEKFLDAGNR